MTKNRSDILANTVKTKVNKHANAAWYEGTCPKCGREQMGSKTELVSDSGNLYILCKTPGCTEPRTTGVASVAGPSRVPVDKK